MPLPRCRLRSMLVFIAIAAGVAAVLRPGPSDLELAIAEATGRERSGPPPRIILLVDGERAAPPSSDLAPREAGPAEARSGKIQPPLGGPVR